MKQRSLLGISKITDVEEDCALPDRGFQRSQRSRDADYKPTKRESLEEHGPSMKQPCARQWKLRKKGRKPATT